MGDNISYIIKLMLLRIIKTARLHTPRGVKNHGWRVADSFLAPSDYRGVRKLTVDTHLRLRKAAGVCNCLYRSNFGQGVFSW